MLVLLSLVVAFSSLRAQEAPAAADILVPERETVVVDNFTAVPNMTLGLYQYARQCILSGLSRRRINVVDVEAEGYGRPDIVYPSFRYAASNIGNPFDINRAIRMMNDYEDARWYMTVYISRFNCHPVEYKSQDKDGKPVVTTTFTADLDAEVYVFDAERQTSEGPIRWRNSYSGANDPETAERNVVSNLEYKARSFVTDRFRFKASILKLGEYNKRGKLQDLYLSCGSDIDVSNGDVFYIYSITEINGIATARKLGKVKAREITGPESCRCTVSNGEAEIDKAFKDGELLVAVSDDDLYF